MKVTVNGKEYDGATRCGWTQTGNRLHLVVSLPESWTYVSRTACCSGVLAVFTSLERAGEFEVCSRCFPKGAR